MHISAWLPVCMINQKLSSACMNVHACECVYQGVAYYSRYSSGVTRVGDTRAATEGVTLFPEKTGDLFLLASSAVFPVFFSLLLTSSSAIAERPRCRVA